MRSIFPRQLRVRKTNKVYAAGNAGWGKQSHNSFIQSVLCKEKQEANAPGVLYICVWSGVSSTLIEAFKPHIASFLFVFKC